MSEYDEQMSDLQSVVVRGTCDAVRHDHEHKESFVAVSKQLSSLESQVQALPTSSMVQSQQVYVDEIRKLLTNKCLDVLRTLRCEMRELKSHLKREVSSCQEVCVDRTSQCVQDALSQRVPDPLCSRVRQLETRCAALENVTERLRRCWSDDSQQSSAASAVDSSRHWSEVSRFNNLFS